MAGSWTAMCYRLDVVEKKTMEGVATYRTVQTLVRDLALIEEKHAKQHQKLLDAAKCLPHKVSGGVTQLYKIWLTELPAYLDAVAKARQKLASDLLRSVVTVVQLQQTQYQAQTLQILSDIRASQELYVGKKYSMNVAKHRHEKIVKAVEAVLRQRDGTRERADSDIAARRALPDISGPSVAALEQKRDELLDSFRARVLKGLSDVDAAQAKYAAAHRDAVAQREGHRQMILAKLTQLDELEEQRIVGLQAKVFAPVVQAYAALERSTTSAAGRFFASARMGLEDARDPTPSSPGDDDPPVAVLNGVVRLLANDCSVAVKVAELVGLLQHTNEAHADRLQQLLSPPWALGPLEGASVNRAWGQLLAGLEVALHAERDYADALQGMVGRRWGALRSAQQSTQRQIAGVAGNIKMKRTGVQLNERDACARYEQALRDDDARLRQLEAAEKEARAEAALPQRDRLVLLGWRDPATVRLEKLRKSYEDFMDTEMATRAKQWTFAKEAATKFTKLFNVLVATVCGDFENAKRAEDAAIRGILFAWETALQAWAVTTQRTLDDVVTAVAAVSPSADLTAFLAAHASPPLPAVVRGVPFELYDSPLLARERRPAPDPHCPEPVKADLRSDAQQAEAALLFALVAGLVLLVGGLGLVRDEVARAAQLIDQQRAAVAALRLLVATIE
ncbi:hypothetical protein ACHHYP_13761 [Achlya hypogyna]|uniref:Uncharacterized protein n=1 Tax=Achlya hypogyna TaxID=1202772 RepID=A0A1V9ZFE3_ACHHY|nr:hypothetical protein ACHHYP_13761 [Achlya hypogyna]